jgi:hypothetical protein
MNAATRMISIWLTLVLLCMCMGCSGEEAAPPVKKKSKVVKRVIQPAPKETPAPLPSEEQTTVGEAKEHEEAQVGPIEEETLVTPEPTAKAPEVEIKELPGYYVVKETASLPSIAEREDVYGDALKWPILYRMNMDKLDILQMGSDIWEKKVPEGLKLRIVTPDEAKENVTKRLGNVWVVNALSSTTNDQITIAAVKLIKAGYIAYIARARIKGQDWIRLRVGFFKDKAEAAAEGEKIKSMLNIEDYWVTKIGMKELEEFGSY